MDWFNRLQPVALLVLRLVLGAIMITHGYHKVFGGFHGHQQFVSGMGLPAWLAYLSTGTESIVDATVLCERRATTPDILRRHLIKTGQKTYNRPKGRP